MKQNYKKVLNKDFIVFFIKVLFFNIKTVFSFFSDEIKKTVKLALIFLILILNTLFLLTPPEKKTVLTTDKEIFYKNPTENTFIIKNNKNEVLKEFKKAIFFLRATQNKKIQQNYSTLKKYL